MFLKLYLLLYADDTVIFSESKEDLQLALNGMSDYCSLWKLKVNVLKTKVIIFSRGKLRNKPSFFYQNIPVEVIDDFSYLGVLFNYNGKFAKAKTRLCNQARKAMFALLVKIRKMSLPLDIQIHLFDSMICPILLYGSEVWGCEKFDVVSQFQLKYLKMLLKCKSCTPNVMVFGELGVYPIELAIKSRMLNFWCSIVTGKQSKISCILYKLMFRLHNDGVLHSNWLLSIQRVLDELGMSHLWLSQNVYSHSSFKNIVKRGLQDQFVQNWRSKIYESSSCLNYRVFKDSFELERYLIDIPYGLAINLLKFRCRNSKLPVVIGQYNNVTVNNRLCTLCDSHFVGDEFHYLLECSFFSDLRKKYIPNGYYIRPNIFKFAQLLQSKDQYMLTRVCIFVKIF